MESGSSTTRGPKCFASANNSAGEIVWLIKTQPSRGSRIPYVARLWKIQNRAQPLPRRLPGSAGEPGPGSSGARRSGHPGWCLPAGQDTSGTSPGQRCPGLGAEALERWAGGLPMGQFQWGSQAVSHLLGPASWRGSVVHPTSQLLQWKPVVSGRSWRRICHDGPNP